jgi:hypothetical protein
MTATCGKIITVYSVALIPGQFTISNSGPTVRPTSVQHPVGLRSEIFGLAG